MTDHPVQERGAYASPWRRLAAVLIDGVIVGILMAGVLIPLWIAARDQDELIPILLIVYLLLLVAAVLYEVALVSRRGATIGKHALGLQVLQTDGAVPGWGISFVRYFTKFLAAAPLLVGLLWSVWDSRRRGWHDMISGTVVVNARRLADTTGAHRESVWEPSDREETPALAADDELVDGVGADAESEDLGWPEQPGPGPAQSEPVAAAHQPPEPEQEAQPVDESQPEQPEQPRDPEQFLEPGQPAAHETGAAPEEPSAEPEPSALAEPSAPEEPSVEPASSAQPEPPQTTAPDPNLTAIGQAQLQPDSADWLRQVAAQVAPRLDQVNPAWRDAPQADASRACTFGLLLGHLANLYPHMAQDLSRTAESHPSFSTFGTGNRLAILQDIAGDPAKMAAWIGPLIGVQEPDRLRRLLA